MRITNGQLSIIRNAAEKGLAILPNGPYPAIIELCDDLSDARNALHSVNTSSEDTARIKNELSAAETDLKRLADEYKHLGEKYGKLREAYSEAIEVMKQYENEFKQLDRQITDLQRENAELRKEATNGQR